MAFFWEKFSTLLSIYVALYIGTVEGMRNHTWTHDFECIAMQDSSSLTSPGQVYGCCDETLVRVHENKFEVSCKFAMETTEAIDKAEHVRFCNFSLNSDTAKDQEMYLLEEIVAITKDKAILKIQGLESHIIWVLDFANCTADNSYTSDYPITLYAPSNDKIDVMFSKNHFFDKIFRIIFNTEGNVVSNEQIWLETDSNIIAVVDSPTKDRLVVDEYRTFMNDPSKLAARVYAVANNGSIEMLKEYPVDRKIIGAPFLEKIMTSITYNFLSVCSRLNMTLKCSQFDLDGNIKFETTVSLEEYPPLYSLTLRNLPRGGFLLFITKCRSFSSGKGTCPLRDPSFDVIKVDATGQLVATLKVNNTSSTGYQGKTHVFEGEKDEVCLSDLQHANNSSTVITLDIICLKDDDFSANITWPTN